MTCVIQVEYRDSLLKVRGELLQSLGRPVISVLGSRAAMALNMSAIAAGAIVIGHRASHAERRGPIEHFRNASPRTGIVVLLGRDEHEFEEADFNCPADNPPLWVQVVNHAASGIQ